MYSLTFAPLLLFVGHLSDTWNRKLMIGICCFLWGLISYANSYVYELYYLYTYRLLLGLVQAFTGPALYSIISDFFPPHLKVRAFFIYATLQQLGDTLTFFTINIISWIGWRTTYKVIGIYSAVFGVICLLFVKEPPRD